VSRAGCAHLYPVDPSPPPEEGAHAPHGETEESSPGRRRTAQMPELMSEK